MSTPNDDLEARLRGLREPDLPADLKARILSAVELPPVVTWRDRVWFSTGWRVAAAALVLALLSADRWIVPSRFEHSPDTDPGVATELDGLEAAGADIGMPAGMMRRLGRRGAFVPHTARLTSEEAMATPADPK
jgi:hypothetical protein